MLCKEDKQSLLAAIEPLSQPLRLFSFWFLRRRLLFSRNQRKSSEQILLGQRPSISRLEVSRVRIRPHLNVDVESFFGFAVANKDRQTLSCGHVMHKKCVTKTRKCGTNGHCPLCRQVHENPTGCKTLRIEPPLSS